MVRKALKASCSLQSARSWSSGLGIGSTDAQLVCLARPAETEVCTPPRSRPHRTPCLHLRRHPHSLHHTDFHRAPFYDPATVHTIPALRTSWSLHHPITVALPLVPLWRCTSAAMLTPPFLSTLLLFLQATRRTKELPCSLSHPLVWPRCSSPSGLTLEGSCGCTITTHVWP